MTTSDTSQTENRWVRHWRQFLAVLVACLPFVVAYDYGGVLPWTKWMVAAASVIALGIIFPLMLLRLPSSRWTYGLPLLMLMFWAFGMFQCLPLPAEVVAKLSPASYQAHSVWSSSVLPSPAETMPLSIAPWYTQSYLILPASFATFVLVGAIVFRGNQAMVLLVVSSVSGIAISYLGIADKISAHHQGHAFFATQSAALPFGPFINRNNAAGFLNLTLACTIGCLVYRYRRRLDARANDPRYQVTGKSFAEQLVSRISRFLRLADTLSVTLLIFAVIIICGIFISGSRGGMLAVLAGTLISAIRALSRGRQFQTLATLSIGCIGVGLALGSLGMMETVQSRFSQIWGDDALADGRLEHWQDSLWASWHYLPFGAGQGTYRFAYLPFQRVGSSAWFLNADGMPFEWLLEGGLVAVGLLLGCVACVYRLLWNLSFYRNTNAMSAVAATIWFAVPSLIVSQCFDFGILMPATSLLTASLMGMLCGAVKPTVSKRKQPGSRRKGDAYEKGLVRTLGSHRDVPSPSTKTKPARSASQSLKHHSLPQRASSESSRRKKGLVDYAMAITCWAGCLVASLLATEQQYEAAQVDDIVRKLDHWRAIQVDALRRIDDLRLDADAALALYPQNPDLLHAASRISVLQSRALVQQSLPATADRKQFEQLWQQTDTDVLRYKFHELQNKTPQPNDVPWQRFLLPGQTSRDLLKAQQQAAQALIYCPLSDRIRYSLVSLDYVDKTYQHTVQWTDELAHLRCRNPIALEDTARLAAVYPGAQQAIEYWETSVQLAPERLGRVYDQMQQMGISADIEKLVPNEPFALLYAVEHIAKDPTVRDHLLDRIEAIIARDGRNSLKVLPSPQASAATSMAAGVRAEGLAEGAADIPGEPQPHRLRRRAADPSEYHYFMGTVASYRQDWEAAESEFQQAVESNPGETAWRERYASILMHNRKPKEAVAQVERCMLQQPNNPRYAKLAEQYRALGTHAP